MKLRRIAAFASAIALLAVSFPSLTGSAQTKVKPGINFFSINQDIQMGRQAAAQVEQQMPIVHDPVVQQWIDTLGHRLSSVTTMPNLPWRFRVTNSSQVNAFALPGGFVYVNRGLIEMTNSEAELAGVMG
ncbi:MAG: M48 family metalloprotease, partial [Blastocatellia bacterium]